MQKRSARTTVVTLLLAAPLAAAYFLWNIDRRSTDGAAAADSVGAHLARMQDVLAEIGAAQQSYVAPGQLDEPWFERTSALVLELRREMAAVQPLLRSLEGEAALRALTESLRALEAADARTRENLGLGQELMAADVIFSDGRHILDAMRTSVRELQVAERAAAGAELAATRRARWPVFGATTLIWLVGILALARVREVPEVREASGPSATAATADTPDTASTPGTPRTLDTVDLPAAAALCTDLSRVSDTAALSALLGHAASLLDASGLILWMGAGEQLFPVLGHGYPAEALAHFGPMARSAENAATAAWRTGRPSVVAGDQQSPGALVAPMFGPGGCIGVLALEVRHGRERDPAVQAVAAMIAAQLATAVAAWPAASASSAPVSEPEARTA